MKHIFVMDDERNIRELIKKYLEKENYKVTTFENSNYIIDEMNRLSPDLLVLDIMVPGIDGLELCRKIRKKSSVPIIFVSAKDDEVDRIIGLELGGDDYLSKPFSPRELVVRIKNIFRRIENPQKHIDNIMEIRDLEIFPDRRIVKKEENEIPFTSNEYEFFEFLVKNKNMPFKREQLIEKIWGYDFIGDERMIDNLVKRVRKKLKEINSSVEIITVWGYGYRIDE